MRSDRLAVAAALIIQSIALSPTVPAAPLFYLSDQPLGLAQPGRFSLDNPAGAGGQLYVYGMTDERLSGVSLDLSASGGGIEFSGLNVVNDGRWWMLDGPQVVEHLRISSIGGGAIPGLSGNGIGPGDFVDPNYHPSSGYLLATVDYRVVDATRPTNFELHVGQNAVADWDGNIPMVHLGDPSLPAVAGTPPPPPPPVVMPDPPKPDPVRQTTDSNVTGRVEQQPRLEEPVFQRPMDPVDPVNPVDKLANPLFQDFPYESGPGYVTSFDGQTFTQVRNWTPHYFFSEADITIDAGLLRFTGLSASVTGNEEAVIFHDDVTNIDVFRTQLAATNEIAGSDLGVGITASLGEASRAVERLISWYPSFRQTALAPSTSFMHPDLTSIGTSLAFAPAALATELPTGAAPAPEPDPLLLIAVAIARLSLFKRRARTRPA